LLSPLVVDDVDGVVALGPEAGARDLRDQLSQVVVAERDQALVLRITAARAAGVDAVRRVAMLIVALIGDDPVERGHVPAAQIAAESADRDLPRDEHFTERT
jgi:hypothetical protein